MILQHHNTQVVHFFRNDNGFKVAFSRKDGGLTPKIF